MIKCKDCCWYEKEHILLNNGSTREYTDTDVDVLGIKHSVSADIGINVGGRCKYYAYNDTCWMGKEDFCSKGQKTALTPNNLMNKTYENFEEWLKEHDEEIRADERRKFAEWLTKSDYAKGYFDTENGFVSVDRVLAKYEKEKAK